MRHALLGLALLVRFWSPPRRWPPRPGAKRSGPQPKGSRAARRAKSLRAGKGFGGQKGKGRGRKRREIPPQMPQQIELTAIDPNRNRHRPRRGGRDDAPPVTQLFILTDQSGRRFVPHFAECHPPPASPWSPRPTAVKIRARSRAVRTATKTATRMSRRFPPAPVSCRRPRAGAATSPSLGFTAAPRWLRSAWSGAQRVAASDQTVQRLGRSPRRRPAVRHCRARRRPPAEPAHLPAGDPPPAPPQTLPLPTSRAKRTAKPIKSRQPTPRAAGALGIVRAARHTGRTRRITAAATGT